METEMKTFRNCCVKVDGNVAYCDSGDFSPAGEERLMMVDGEWHIDKDGEVDHLMIRLPSQQMTDLDLTCDRPFGPDKLAKANDPALKEGKCEVEVLNLNKGWHSVWKGTANRKFLNMTEGRIRVGGEVGEVKTAFPLKAIVRLDTFSPRSSLFWNKETDRLGWKRPFLSSPSES